LHWLNLALTLRESAKITIVETILNVRSVPNPSVMLVT